MCKEDGLENLQELYETIGNFIAEFNDLEESLTYYLKELISPSEGRDTVALMLIGSLSFAQKNDTLLNIAGYLYPHKRNSIKELYDDLSALNENRNTIVHGMYDLEKQEQAGDITITSTRVKRKKFDILQQSEIVTLEGIKDARDSIVHIHTDLDGLYIDGLDDDL